MVTHAPSARIAIGNYFEALKNNDFATMYALLTQSSRDAMTQDDFSLRYNDFLNTLSVTGLDYEITGETVSPSTARAAFRVTYHSTLAGNVARDMTADLSLESGDWRIQWIESLMLPELAGGNRLALDCVAPVRGDIFDRNGEPLVTTTEAVALGINTSTVGFKNLPALTYELWLLTGVNPKYLSNRVVAAGPGWTIPVGTTSVEEGARLLNWGFSGLVVTPYTSRYYANSGMASQTLGYSLGISPEDINTYKRQGYCGNERVGYAGIEKSREDLLAGKHGGTLYVADPQGQIVANLAQSEASPSSTVYLTLDKKLQKYADQALSGFTGAAVVIERDTGRVLAMASSPGFDANVFDPLNVNNAELLPQILNDPDRPLYNRATQGQYPLGSVFKVITFSAALESGLYLPETTYDCQYDFTELADRTLHDWTWQHCQDRLAGGRQCDTTDSRPSGLLTLQEGLMRSCDPYFWHIGRDLYLNNRAGDIAKMAEAFGLGAPTGIEIDEEAGQIIIPTDEIAATNQAIGQGDNLVTPLQVARFIAAVGNGGTLYRPHIIEKVVGPDGTVTQTFAPEAVGTLPLQPERLAALQQAMTWVVSSPRGTANFRLVQRGGFNIAAAGKTGTAETGAGIPHAWFAGYTFADIEGVPDIAVAVLLENIGEGSDYAAPIFQYIVESYFFGSPQHTFVWFGQIGGSEFYTPTPFGGIPTKPPKTPRP
jgi:penicillin-binding protein 2